MGLFGGVGLAFFFEWLDNSVKNFEDVEKVTGLPGLGLVPTFSVDGVGKGYGYGYRIKVKKEREKKEGESDDQGRMLHLGGSDVGGEREGEKGGEREIRSLELITHFSPKSNISENYRSIRTTLLLSSPDDKLKSMVISSPLSQEGKTSTISNLAVTFAQAGKVVLVVDSDLRKPKLHKIFKIKNLRGLTNYLTDGVEIKDLIKETDVPNLFLINAGPVPPNPVELLGSEKMAEFIRSVKESFDYVFFDSPPLLAVSDALVMGPQIDGVVLTVWGGKTSREALKRTKEKLDQHKIKTVGVILNNVNIKENDYYYMKHYYKYYGESEL